LCAIGNATQRQWDQRDDDQGVEDDGAEDRALWRRQAHDIEQSVQEIEKMDEERVKAREGFGHTPIKGA
jgi:hypothetical protein